MPTVTEICSQSLARIGSLRLDNFETDATPQAIQCRLHYEQTLKSCLRSNRWSFAKTRAALSADATPPAFGYSFQYLLPADCLRVVSVNGYDVFDYPNDEFSIENNRILTDEETVNIVYIRYVSNPNEFDPLFTEFLILSLALKLLYPIAGLSTGTVKESLTVDWDRARASARIVSETENNTTGYSAWHNSRLYNPNQDDPAQL